MIIGFFLLLAGGCFRAARPHRDRALSAAGVAFIGLALLPFVSGWLALAFWFAIAGYASYAFLQRPAIQIQPQDAIPSPTVLHQAACTPFYSEQK